MVEPPLFDRAVLCREVGESLTEHGRAVLDRRLMSFAVAVSFGIVQPTFKTIFIAAREELRHQVALRVEEMGRGGGGEVVMGHWAGCGGRGVASYFQSDFLFFFSSTFAAKAWRFMFLAMIRVRMSRAEGLARRE